MQVTRLANILAWCLLALLGFATVFLGYLTIRVFTDLGRTYSPEDIIAVSGRITRVEERPQTQLWLEGHALPFRVILVREDFKEVLHREGEPANLGILRTELTSPPRDRWHGQDFLNVYTLEINGRTILSLDDYNRWSSANGIGLRIFVPILLLACIGLWVYMLWNRHRPMPKLIEHEPRAARFREVVPVGIVLGVLLSVLLGFNGWLGKNWAGQWAGPGTGGLLMGIACGLTYGMSLAAIPVALSHALLWTGKSKRRSKSLQWRH
jgi:hypothetical protein